jgi:hypothetical protein
MLSSHSHQSPLFIRCNQRIGFRDLPPWAGHSKSSTVHLVQPTNRFQGLATLGWTQQVVVFCHFCMNGPNIGPPTSQNYETSSITNFGTSDRTISSIYYRANCTAQSKRQPVPACARHQVVDCFSSGKTKTKNQNVLQRRVAYLYIFAQREVIICNSSVQQRTKDEPIG